MSAVRPCRAVAVGEGLIVFPLNGENSCAHQDRAGVVGFARDGLVEIGERTREFVIALQDRRARDEHGGGRIRILPPRRQRSLRVTQVARIAFATRNSVICIGERYGRIDIAGFGSRHRPQTLEIAIFDRAPVGQAFKHLRIVGGQEGLGRGRRGERKGQQKEPQDCAAADHFSLPMVRQMVSGFEEERRGRTAHAGPFDLANQATGSVCPGQSAR